MKRVLCYGDSNTWGFIPATGERYPETVRWTGLLQTMLGADHQIVEGGLNGRTTVWEDPVRDFMNSAAYLGPCLLSQFPLDLIVFMLGTNDLKQRFHLNAWSIAEGLRQNLRLIARSAEQGGVQKPAILVVAPILIGDNIELSPFADEFEGARTIEISRQLGRKMARVAEEMGCYFLDAAPLAAPSRKDAIHMEPEGHRAIADALAQQIRAILG